MRTHSFKQQRAWHRGITLVELLVVIFIMLIVTAIAIPTMTPSIEQRRLRETSRVITSHFQGARTRAIQTGKFFGVMIEPQSGLTAAGITLSYMAESEPWHGDTTDSRARVVGGFTTPSGSPCGYLEFFVSAATGQLITETSWKGIVRPGDIIRFDSTGRWYQISSGEPFTDTPLPSPLNNGVRDTSEPFTDLDADGNYDGPNLVKGAMNAVPWTLIAFAGGPIPSTNLRIDVDMDGIFDSGDEYNGFGFTVRRQPTRTAAHPLQLPNAMVVDLNASGTSGLSPLNGLGPITVLFTPTGAMHSIYYHQNSLARSLRLTSPLYLLVGKVDKIGAATGERNYEDMTNFWVTIHPQTGLITSTEVGQTTPHEPYVDANGNGQHDTSETYTDVNGNSQWDDAPLTESRFFAERALALGGR